MQQSIHEIMQCFALEMAIPLHPTWSHFLSWDPKKGGFVTFFRLFAIQMLIFLKQDITIEYI